MKSNWIKEFYVIHFVNEEFQNFKYGFQDCKLLPYFSVSIIIFVLKYGGRFHLVNQFLIWIHWKSDYT
jgi:hypothetical protein